MNRVLVIGGNGFVGSHIVRALVAAGCRPTLFGPAMDGDRLADLADAFDVIEGSILSRDALADALRSSAAEAVVSCAAYGAGRLGLMRSGEAHADAALDVNVVGLGKLLDAARLADVRRMVWTSSTVVYGPASTYPAQKKLDESAPVGPVTFYGLTKALAEQVSLYHRQRYGMDVVALRLPLVLGRGLWYEGAVASLAGLFRAPPPTRLAFHDEPIDLIHVADAAAAVIALLQCARTPAPVYNLEGFSCTASALLSAIADDRGEPPIPLDVTPHSILFPLVSGARLRADTGFAPTYDLPRFVAAMMEAAE